MSNAARVFRMIASLFAPRPAQSWVTIVVPGLGTLDTFDTAESAFAALNALSPSLRRSALLMDQDGRCLYR